MFQSLFSNMQPVVKNLLIINVLFFLATFVFERQGIDLGSYLGLYYIDSPKFQPYQLATHFFMHAGIGHLFFNMFALVMFGSQLEKVWGPKRFLFFYIFSAVGAFLIHTGAMWYELSTIPAEYVGIIQAEGLGLLENSKNYSDPELGAANIKYFKQLYTPTVGASGAIMGLMAAFAFLFPNTELMLIFLPIPVKAKYFIPFMMMLELSLGVGNFEWDNISHFAHLGGALFGFILVVIWQKDKNRMY